MSKKYEIVTFSMKDKSDGMDVILHLSVESNELPIFTIAKGDENISFKVDLLKLKEAMNYFILSELLNTK